MESYRPNPVCSCLRCRARGIMGPAILIVLGVMLLLHNLAYELGTRQLNFNHTWPLLLIVIGLVKIFQANAPTDGHVPPETVAQIAPAPPPPSPPSEVHHV